MLFAIPGLAEVLFSHEAITMTLGMQYTATWSAYLLCAFVDGASKVYYRSEPAAKATLLLAFVASLWTSRYYSPISPGYALYRRPVVADYLRVDQLRKLPRAASVGTGGFIIGHLGMYPRATIAMSDQDYLIFDAFSNPAYWDTNDKAKVAQLIKAGRYEKVFDGVGIVVLEKKKVRP
jgi:hypothetical protein